MAYGEWVEVLFHSAAFLDLDNMMQNVKEKMIRVDETTAALDELNDEVQKLKDRVELVALKPLTQASQVDKAEEDITSLALKLMTQTDQSSATKA